MHGIASMFLGTAFPLEVVHPGLKGLQAEGNLIFSPAQSLHCCTALVDSKKFRIQLKFSAEWTTSLSGKLKIIVKLCFLSRYKQKQINIFCPFSGICLVLASWTTKNKCVDLTYKYLNIVVEKYVQRLMVIDKAATRQHLLREYPIEGDRPWVWGNKGT